ncbi:hypothetical protein H671_3g11076 [Cricetulus griseus]|nr:hypothetical protein H671_3g11076 [Cricetulus griseus]
MSCANAFYRDVHFEAQHHVPKEGSTLEDLPSPGTFERMFGPFSFPEGLFFPKLELQLRILCSDERPGSNEWGWRDDGYQEEQPTCYTPSLT